MRKLSAFFKQFQLNESEIINLRTFKQKILFLTWFCVFLYVLSEWIFFITKSSFLIFMEPINQFSLLFLTDLAFLIPIIPLFIFLMLLGKIKKTYKIYRLFIYLYLIIPVYFLSIMCLLLFDNFTYTVFRFGIVSTYNLTRILYLIGFLLLVLIIYKGILSFVNFTMAEKFFKNAWIINLLILIPLVSLLVRTDWNNNFAHEEISASANSKPNIILLGCDGISADNMSVYGYEKETTPFLKQFAQSSLVAENAFTNSAKTTGSTVSILTGKLPFYTRVVYPPDILHKNDAYEHLPGILQNQGYFTVQIGVPHYVDANAVNLREGFNIVNGRKNVSITLSRLIEKFDVDNMPYFWNTLNERTTDRLFHIFFIRIQPDTFQILNRAQRVEDDLVKIDEIIQTLESSDKPVFIHAHLMVTHTIPSESDQQIDAITADAIYDNAINSYDQMVETLVQYLENSGKSSNTVLILYSDHSRNWNDIYRIPLIIHFPNDQYKGKISVNVQNLDIAPTVLDYMGLPVPDWMTGQSLIGTDLPADRPIFSTNIIGFDVEGNVSFLNKSFTNPPFYQFLYVDTFICQKITRLDLQKNAWMQSEVNNYQSHCEPTTLPDISSIQTLVLNLLKSNKFDTSSINFEISNR